MSYPLHSKELYTLLMNLVHFLLCRVIYSYALQIRFAPLSRGAPGDMNLNAGLQSVVHNDVPLLIYLGENNRFQYTLGLRWA